MVDCTGNKFWDGRPVRCGKCLGCRQLAAWVKARRIALETILHADERSWFFTLTFRNLPAGDGYQLVQLWLKQVRKAVEPRKVRFVCVREHGSRNGRLHYHGFVWCEDVIKYRELVPWSHGFYKYVVANTEAWSYIAKYIVKEGGKVRGSQELGKGLVQKVADHPLCSSVLEHFSGARIVRIRGVRVPRDLSDRFAGTGSRVVPMRPPEAELTRDELLSYSSWNDEDD